jgi:hypothetical protein
MIPELGHYALMLAAAGAHSTLLFAVQPDVILLSNPVQEARARSVTGPAWWQLTTPMVTW